MRAAVYEDAGPAAKTLTVVDLPDPEPTRGEVRVRIRISGVNPVDCKERALGSSSFAGHRVPHHDGAGTIDRVGPGVNSARIGQRVWVYHAAFQRRFGTAAEFVCLPERQAVPLPPGVSFVQAAGLGIPYITAHRCLFADGPITGHNVLVTGGAGAVGNAAIQLARWAGAYVISTASSSEKWKLAQVAGAHRVLDYRSASFADQLRSAAPKGVHRVVDVALHANLGDYAETLASDAVICAYARGLHDPVMPMQSLMRQNVSVHFILVFRLANAAVEWAIRDISSALEDHVLRPLPDHLFQLDNIAGAHEAVEGGVIGKVLVEMPDPAKAFT